MIETSTEQFLVTDELSYCLGISELPKVPLTQWAFLMFSQELGNDR